MIPELGQFALIIALAFATIMAVVPLVAVRTNSTFLLSYSQPLAYATFVFSGVAIFLLGYSFAVDDFSVKYVAEHSNSLLPTGFKIAAVWGGHEGSLLLWVFSLSGWIAAVAYFSKQLEAVFLARVLAVLAFVFLGFNLFLLLTSNPFERLIPAAMEGRDLNPMLQDIGLIIHPPMLYLGYVGFAVSFAFAIAALMSGRLDSAWAKWSRPWTLVAWLFLTAGIALGSWWAYYELGWGGWWFWDPVENASFMPWIVGTALLHSLIVTEKRAAFRNWTVLLAIFAFSLSLLGTFIVRSGVLTSVHSFASDPSRGMFILALLLLTIGASLTLFALRASGLKSPAKYDLFSKEAFLLIGNVILSAACATVLIGTLYPLIYEGLGLGKISVGPPYFNAVFVPLSLILFVFMGVGSAIRWKKDKAENGVKKFGIPAVLAIAIGIVVAALYGEPSNLWVILGVSSALWVTLAVIRDVRHAYQMGKGTVPRSVKAMALAHLGIAVTVIGVTMVSNFSIEKSVRMGPGKKIELGGYTFHHVKTETVQGPNYVAKEAQIDIYEDNTLISTIYPDRRQYTVRVMDMTEAGIDWGLFRDLYVTMGDPINETEYAVRINIKPFVRWIWFGAILMAFGALLGATDKRYRRGKVR